MRKTLLIVFIFCLQAAKAQKIDVQHYLFEIELSDLSDTIYGKATITIKFPEATDHFSLDFVPVTGGTGMQVQDIQAENIQGPVLFTIEARQENELDASKLHIRLNQAVVSGDKKTFTIKYKGKPKDGLIISKNLHGDRTFFSDNWPTRAHHWIPCNDRPDDKASFEFVVTAPAHYKVISNGVKIGEKHAGKNLKTTHWKEKLELPTKVMAIGVAKFAVKEYASSPKMLPVTAWIYEQDSSKGFKDYSTAPEILKFFTGYIAPFPYEKLANVQSTTIFGGMENASAIFYNETSVTGRGGIESLLAHEIAHQWFGNMASEMNFSHLWLSEGFATYLTHIYLEHKYGKETLKKGLQEDRKQVIEFAKANNNIVVDSLLPYMNLLNANSYQKGGWILHMLRTEVGDTVFQKILKTYYQLYKGGNASSRDFEEVAEKVSDKELSWFFDQWLYRPGVPELDISITKHQEKNVLVISQKQPHKFRFSLDIAYGGSQGRTLPGKEIRVNGATTYFELPANIKEVFVDPNVRLLYNGPAKVRKK